MCFRRSRLTGIVGVICLLLVFQGIAYGQTNRISGQIFGANRRPQQEVYVELANEINTVISRVKTDAGGRYLFSGMPAGRYLVRARPFGTDYEEQIQEVELITSVGTRNTPDNQQKDFYLTPNRDANKRPDQTGVVFAQEIPEEAKKAYDKALAEIEANRPDAGIIELEKATKIFPDYYKALDRLGTELLNKQQFAEAKKFCCVAHPPAFFGEMLLFGLIHLHYHRKVSNLVDVL